MFSRDFRADLTARSQVYTQWPSIAWDVQVLEPHDRVVS